MRDAAARENNQKQIRIDAENVRRLRLARKMTMAQLAKDAMLSESAVRDIETKPIKRRRMLTVERLAMALGVSPVSLMSEGNKAIMVAAKVQ